MELVSFREDVTDVSFIFVAEQEQHLEIFTVLCTLSSVSEVGALRLGICAGNRKVAGFNSMDAKSDSTRLGP